MKHILKTTKDYTAIFKIYYYIEYLSKMII